jgi:hypothetical protein
VNIAGSVIGVDRTPDLVNAIKRGINEVARLRRDSFRTDQISGDEAAERCTSRRIGFAGLRRSDVGGVRLRRAVWLQNAEVKASN